MILWRLHSSFVPDGELEPGEMLCAIEPSEEGYRLLVENNGETLVHESHDSLHTARGKAELLKSDLLNKGWAPE